MRVKLIERKRRHSNLSMPKNIHPIKQESSVLLTVWDFVLVVILVVAVIVIVVVVLTHVVGDALVCYRRRLGPSWWW